jgi:predicted AlkP superfamily phosphohydrolase/phosphomutase
MAIQAPFWISLFGGLLACFLLITWPIRWLLRRNLARGPQSTSQVVILGLDGLEPSLVETGIAEGWLPSFAKIKQQGCLRNLGTTCPPLSPVAWSTFATGVNPGKHGIFDFVHRDANFNLVLSMATVTQQSARLWNWILPWRVDVPKILRKSQSFWSILGNYGIFSHIIRVPVSWPAEPFFGVQLSAMGAPDLAGTQGTYTLCLAKDTDETAALHYGQKAYWQKTSSGHKAEISLEKLGSFEIELEPSGILNYPKGQITLEVDHYSQWLSFPIGKTCGMARFLLLSLNPPKLYLTPIQIDPERPQTPISHPSFYSAALSKQLGRFATCGMAEDTGACEEQVLSSQQFLQQCRDIHQERRRQFLHCLERSNGGLCVAVFDGADRIQHMLWENAEEIRRLYIEMDQLLQETVDRMEPQSLLMVLSDHGFKGLKRTVDLNCWLEQEGYLVRADGQTIDFSRTRACAIGLAGIHLNVVGRDAQGIVEPSAAQALKDELLSKLEQLVDPVTQEKPLARVFDSQAIYQGPYQKNAPDLVLGFQVGYRISRQAARGLVGEQIFDDNRSLWSGDHCFAPAQVPGVLLCNRALTDGPAHLRDIAPTVLNAFGVPSPSHFEGHSLLMAGSNQRD